MSKKLKQLSPSIEQKLPVEIVAEIDQLSILLQAIKGNCIVFALYHSVSDRELVVGQLKKRVPGIIQELFLSEKRKDVIGLLASLDGRHRLKNQGIFLYDLEQTFPESLGNLNLQRETLAEIPHPLVFWIREYALREIAEKAPDFWAWRSEVFDFRLAQTEFAESTVKGYLSEKSFYHKTREDLDRCISLFRELLAQQEQEENPDQKMIAYLSCKIGSMYEDLSDYQNALRYLIAGLTISREISDKENEGKALNLIGIVNYKRGDLQTAFHSFDQYLKICDELGDRSGLAACYGNQALILKDWGKLDDAMVLLKKQEQICAELGDRAGLAACYGNQALILKDWGKLDDALALHQKEEQIAEELGDRSQASRSYGNQALILQAWGKQDEALALHQKQESIKKELGDIAGLALSYSGQGLILYAQGKLEKALNLYKKEEKICVELGDRAGLARTWWNQGIIYGQKGDKKKQIELCQQSIDMNKSIGIPTGEDEKALEEL